MAQGVKSEEDNMSKFEVGDLVKGLPESNKYGITNENMTKGVVQEVTEAGIVVKVLKHKMGSSGRFTVDPGVFEKIGHLEPFDREKFLELLKESKTKATDYLRCVNLSGADLSNTNLSNTDLSGADLSNADLSNTNLSNADLSSADLRYTNLRGAGLSSADLEYTNLSNADLSSADLGYTNLSNADLSSADLGYTNLRGADLSDANLRGADLSNTNLGDANLRGANLKYASLSGSKGLLDAINYMEAYFERTDEGYIVYKSFGENYTAPKTWKIESGSIIEETVNCDRTTECGCGINVAPLEWVRKYGSHRPYKLLIRWEWLPGVVVPYNTDGKIRCSKAQILEAVE